jgi:hypothetical protein
MPDNVQSIPSVADGLLPSQMSMLQTEAEKSNEFQTNGGFVQDFLANELRLQLEELLNQEQFVKMFSAFPQGGQGEESGRN